MKKYMKRNQVLITALAIMIAIAGYLSFQDKQKQEAQVVLNSDSEGELVYDLSLEELGEEDWYYTETENETVAVSDFLETQMVVMNEELAEEAGMEYEDEGLTEEELRELIPGEAVFTSTSTVTSLSGAKLLKEQTRAKNKETLMEIINNTNISDEAKAEAIETMVWNTQIAEKEMNAEILLEAKGFTDTVVSVSNQSVDVCIVAEQLTDAQRAQIEDIVQRKTEMDADCIVITTVW